MEWNFLEHQKSVPFRYLYDIFIKNATGPYLSSKQRKNGIPLRSCAFRKRKKKKKKNFPNEKKILLDLSAYANSLCDSLESTCGIHISLESGP